ncbi:MAG: Gfo/Idh/MocA family oxidoreductase [Calothrix sp. MO_192.B10]|nr:Gfo/Idh/MocA family oxidoreductase [Calothrix sp. MO_192.B10]
MITVGQIGCGYWGPNLLRNLSSHPNCHVKWVAEQSHERQAYVENNYPKTKTTSNWEDIINDSEVDAVIVATPASTHYELTKAVLKAGKHVLVEKPLAMCTREADELVALGTTAEKILMVGHTFLYNSAVRYAKKLVDQGELGQTYYIYSQRLNLGQVRTDVNAWWNLAPHDISILLYLMDGELPIYVTAHGIDYIQPGIEDVVFANLTWANKVTAHIQVSWLDPGKIRRMTLVGSRKMVVYDDISDDKIKILDKGIDRVPKIGERMDYDNFNNYQLFHRTGDVLLPRINLQEPLKVEINHFLECIQTGQTPLTGPKHARDVVAVLEMVQQALSGNKNILQPISKNT